MKNKKYLKFFYQNRKEIEVRTMKIRKLLSQIEFFMKSCDENIKDHINGG